MFVRRTQTRSTANGEHYFTHRLVCSVRNGARVRCSISVATSRSRNPPGLRPRSVGVEVALWAIEQVQLMPLLGRLGFNGRQRAAAVGSIIGRMAAPGSERAIPLAVRS